MSFCGLYYSIEMCRWRESEEEPEGHSAMSAATKWVQFKLQNIHHGVYSIVIGVSLSMFMTAFKFKCIGEKKPFWQYHNRCPQISCLHVHLFPTAQRGTLCMWRVLQLRTRTPFLLFLPDLFSWSKDFEFNLSSFKDWISQKTFPCTHSEM